MISAPYLLNKIESSFSQVRYPVERDFYRAAADMHDLDYEPQSTQKQWMDVTKSDLRKNCDFLFYLDHDGMVYYLPAYMSLMLKYDELADCPCVETLLMTMPKLRCRELDIDIRRTIQEFLIYFRHEFDCENCGYLDFWCGAVRNVRG